MNLDGTRKAKALCSSEGLICQNTLDHSSQVAHELTYVSVP